MGEIMEHISAKELAKKEGIGMDALRARWDKLSAKQPELFRERWDKNRPINFAQETALRSAKSAAKKGRTKRENPGVTSEPARANELAPIAPAKSGLSLDKIRAVAFDAVCISAVVGHAGLIWYDCAVMWETPGIIGGGMAFLFAIAGLLIATDPAKPRTSGAALWFMFLVDCAAWFVHYPTFLMSANIGEIETGALCGFICLLSFAALYLYQDSKID